MSDPLAGLSAKTRQTLGELAAQTGKSVQEILDQAVEDYRRKLFLDAVNAGYAALRADPQAWAEVEAERQSMAGSLMDGLDPNERWDRTATCCRRSALSVARPDRAWQLSRGAPPSSNGEFDARGAAGPSPVGAGNAPGADALRTLFLPGNWRLDQRRPALKTWPVVAFRTRPL